MEIESDIQGIISAAMTTPTGDNAQPFHFVYRQKGILEVHHNAIHAKHHLNYAGTGSLITLGFCLELISIEAAFRGLTPIFSFLPSLGSQEISHWLTIEFISGSQCSSELRSAIELRCVDRRLFNGGDLESDVFQDMKQDLLAFKSLICSPHRVNPDLLKYLLECETLTFAHKPVISDILNWVRFSKKEKFETRDGLYWNNLGLNWFESRSLLLVKKFPKLGSFMLRAGLKKKIETVFVAQMKSSAGILLFSTKDSSNLGLVEGGRGCMRAWLHLTLQGYGVQPMTVSTLCLLDWKLNRLSPVISQKYRHNFAQGLIEWQKTADLPDDTLPFWAFRVGLSSNLPEDYRTIRRNLDYYLQLD